MHSFYLLGMHTFLYLYEVDSLHAIISKMSTAKMNKINYAQNSLINKHLNHLKASLARMAVDTKSNIIWQSDIKYHT